MSKSYVTKPQWRSEEELAPTNVKKKESVRFCYVQTLNSYKQLKNLFSIFTSDWHERHLSKGQRDNLKKLQ